MDAIKFHEVIKARIDKCILTLGLKAEEYAKVDRLHNFKKAAEIMRTSKEKALLGFATKHLVSVFDLVDDLSAGGKVDSAAWDEKIGDLINYFLLLDACFQEKK